MAFQSPLSNTERQEQVTLFVEQHQRVTVAELCARFSVSFATARRDLELLAKQGRLRRVHGGALALHRSPPELPVLERSSERADLKKRIGLAAAALVSDGETIFLGSGTTALEVAYPLRQRRDLTVITNSLLVASALVDAPEITVVCLGGILRRSELSMIGHLAEKSLGEVRADKVILGIRAIDLRNGLTNEYLPETMTDRAILNSGRKAIIVADHSKFGLVSTAFVAPLTAVHTLVTDSGTPPEYISALRDLGIQVIVA